MTPEEPSLRAAPRAEFLALAENCGATLTGKPDGSESITVVFSIEAWRKFDAAAAKASTDSPADEQEALRRRIEVLPNLWMKEWRCLVVSRQQVLDAIVSPPIASTDK